MDFRKSGLPFSYINTRLNLYDVKIIIHIWVTTVTILILIMTSLKSDSKIFQIIARYSKEARSDMALILK